MAGTKNTKEELIDNLKICLVLVVIGTAMTYVFCDSCRNSTKWFIKFSSFTSIMWISLWMGNAYTSDWISRFISWTEYPIKRFLVGMVVMVVYTSGAVYLLLWLFRILVNFDIEGGSGMIYGSLVVTFMISTFMHGKGFLQNWKQAVLDAEVAKREIIKAQYEALKNQVNPHFLFNSLNVLTNLVYENPDKAAAFIKKLSDVYRYVLDSRGKELATLEEELNFAKSYVYLQQIRFGENLKVDFTLNGDVGQVVPLAIQMLVENAIKHNEISALHPLRITIAKEANHVVVRNDIKLRAQPLDSNTGLGLENIKNRYLHLSNMPVEVLANNTAFAVKIPLLK